MGGLGEVVQQLSPPAELYGAVNAHSGVVFAPRKYPIRSVRVFKLPHKLDFRRAQRLKISDNLLGLASGFGAVAHD